MLEDQKGISAQHECGGTLEVEELVQDSLLTIVLLHCDVFVGSVLCKRPPGEVDARGTAQLVQARTGGLSEDLKLN